ncbi:putative nitric oxide reductase, NorZ [Corynebacterium sp. CMW7794]|uniref:Nitric-oxide reductase large subunit n=1 Tax=Corynebacterium phoceense TaxID=1686286 RepID=A0A540R8M9_9CORY|nr:MULTISPECIES: nitric-oxide reductase large subunit [Corynebacterium]KXI18257.1 putative nitric oxide reductase, NorZ [Corynebacterium sp. CMW7794]MBF9010246.1 nitric-oxide reductase large subunit [Corynebacterium phoceense]OFL79869.1 nitric oxide reductase [Corynebacterium sp. HMSC077B05]OFP17843.1 nitric oxide reductase [Corynebacterium sp. HMSC065A05]TQE44101.1 nitric-oxide reductase large subunit [Corynebacterium phoceense]
MSITTSSEDRSKPVLKLSSVWVQGVALVMIFGFLVMGFLAYRTYTASMPLPDKIVSQSTGETILTKEEILNGQALYQARGLQQYGSVMGHGAYLGPDYTAEYLRMAADKARELNDQNGYPDFIDENVTPEQAVIDEFRTNRYNEDTKVLEWTDNQIAAFESNKAYYAKYFGEDSHEKGLPSEFITDDKQINNLVGFFGWTAWASAAERPGHDYSYTNNWPAEPRVDNGPTADLVVWSVLSLIALIGGTGLIFAIYGRWSKSIGWHAEEAPNLDFTQPSEVGLTKSQKVVAWFVLVIVLLFLIQALLGAASQHYRTELTGFFGIPLQEILPYNVSRTWHLQLSLLWTAGGLLAAGIFIASFVGKKEPKGQHWLVWFLLGAIAFVVFGSMAFEWLSTMGYIKEGTLFSQQWEFLDLPRFFQVLLTVGMFVWIFILFRQLRGRLKTENKSNMPWMFFYAGIAIPAFYAVGNLAGSETHISVAEFWRFWVVHLWVEDFLELFTTVMVAYVFVLLGVIREKIALGIIFLDIILYSTGGVLGTMHHLYFSGTPVEHMALGAFFSAAEVVPLTLLTVEAWTFMQLGSRQRASGERPFPHRWAVMFLVAVGFWNFLGAGIFGFLVNLPIVSYYEIGTALTANHAHGAMMGVYGFLALGLSAFALRYLIPKDKWSDKAMAWSFWLTNLGLLWMVVISLLPLGIMQLYESVASGYVEARSLGYITEPGNFIMEWLRMPGDVMFLAGIFPFLWMALKGVLYNKEIPTIEEHPTDPLFSIIAPDDDDHAGEIPVGSSVGLVSGGKGRVDDRRRVAGRKYGYIDERGAFVEEVDPDSGRGDSAASGPQDPKFDSRTKWGGTYGSDKRNGADGTDADKK